VKVSEGFEKRKKGKLQVRGGDEGDQLGVLVKKNRNDFGSCAHQRNPGGLERKKNRQMGDAEGGSATLRGEEKRVENWPRRCMGGVGKKNIWME